MSKLQPVRGTHDILPEEARKRHALGNVIRAIAERYGYGEIRTPVFEFSEVFHRTLGDTSDIVSKETYTFADRGGESLTLRPEFTAAAARAFLSNGMQNALPVKWYYYGPAFRYERPQKGRQRQFHQYGLELLGVAEPEADVEVIALAAQILEAVGLKEKARLELNSLGDGESRKAYREALVEYLQAHADALSEDSRLRLERNPLRVLDSKDENDKRIIAGAPRLENYFSESAKDFFVRVKRGLEGLGIAYTLNDRLVRGLDYYNHTVFEFIAEEGLGAQSTLIAGGRYDGLVEQMGGASTPGVGFGAGEERLLLAGIDWRLIPGADTAPPVAVVPVSEGSEAEAWKLAQALRKQGVAVDIAYRGNVKKRMQRADKIGATVALLLGEDEMKSGTIGWKDLKTGEQKTVAMADVATHLQRRTMND